MLSDTCARQRPRHSTRHGPCLLVGLPHHPAHFAAHPLRSIPLCVPSSLSPWRARHPPSQRARPPLFLLGPARLLPTIRPSNCTRSSSSISATTSPAWLLSQPSKPPGVAVTAAAVVEAQGVEVPLAALVTDAVVAAVPRQQPRLAPRRAQRRAVAARMAPARMGCSWAGSLGG